MTNPQKPSIPPYFGPRSKISSRLKMAHPSRVRKTRKWMTRFVSPRMNKIEEEIKRQRFLRTTGVANQSFVPQRSGRNVPKIGNSVQPKTIATSMQLTPLATSVGKSNHSPSTSQRIDKDLTSKVNSHVKHSGIVKDKDATVSPSYLSNGTLRPLELSRKAKMKQGLAHRSNYVKRSYLQTNHLKAIPKLVRNTENRPNLAQGATKELDSESGPDGCIGGLKDKNMSCVPLPGPKIQGDMPKRRRIYRDTSDDDDDTNDHQSDNDDSTRLLSFDATLKDCNTKVSTSFVSKCVAEQHDSCSKPIDEPTWSGILNIDSEKYIVAGHLSTKSGEKVWNLSTSLRRVVEATKVYRSKVWPKRWESSGPTSDNIGLYFFPYKMRPNKHHDQLLKEIMENDLALRVTTDEAEMLIFSSSLLPEQYQTFQSKHYLWGVFRPRLAERKHGDKSGHVDSTAEAATNATNRIPINTTVAATNVCAVPTEAPKFPTKAHTEPTNQGWIDSSMGALPGSMISFVVRQTPRVEQLIQEMEREGAVIVAMQGEMLTGDGSLSSR